MKYKFEKISEDKYKLSYKDKEFEFKCNVKMMSELQNIVAQARIQMIQDYAKSGRSIKELVIEEKKDGKTYYDNTNKDELEKIYNEKLTLEYFDSKCNEIFGMNLVDLMQDIGVSDNEAEKFATELTSYLSGKIPS